MHLIVPLINYIKLLLNPNLYGDNDDDILQGGQGADYFDRGEGIDVIIGSNFRRSRL